MLILRDKDKIEHWILHAILFLLLGQSGSNFCNLSLLAKE